MFKLKYLLFVLFFFVTAKAENKKVYFYTTQSNINSFKSLKVNFDGYLKQFGAYEFQAFTDKDTFESYLKKEDCIVILSSWHYSKLAKEYNLAAKLVAQKEKEKMTTKLLVGKKGASFSGTLTTPFNKEYATRLMNQLVDKHSFKMINVPKEIDALMSVRFGMSQFALVSQDSFEFLTKNNAPMAKQLAVYAESIPRLRMLVASKGKQYNKKLIQMFTSMRTKLEGQKVLNMLGIDNMAVLSSEDLHHLGGAK